MSEHIIKFHRDDGHLEVMNMRYFLFLDRQDDHFRVVYAHGSWSGTMSPAEADRFLAALEEYNKNGADNDRRIDK